MKKLFLLSATILGLFFGMNAQDTTDVTEKLSKRDIARSKYKRAIMLVPQYATINGLRIDLEFRAGNNSLVFGPAVYVDNSPNDFLFIDNDYESMVGLGMDIAYKINLVNPNKVFVPYGAINIGYSWKQITTEGSGYDNYYDIITYFEGTKDIGVNKISADVLLGFQITPAPRFVIDISGGVGGRYSFADSYQEFIDSNYSDNFFSIAYTGILPIMNVKLGLKF